MEIKTTLNKPYTFEEKRDFVVTQNHNLGYKIQETAIALEAWGYTQEETEAQERERIDNLTLTAADVERAIYKDKNIDFEDLINLVQEQYSDIIDVKRLKIELKANSFFRKHEYINKLGELLGYTPFQLDYLFENKEFPADIN